MKQARLRRQGKAAEEVMRQAGRGRRTDLPSLPPGWQTLPSTPNCGLLPPNPTPPHPTFPPELPSLTFPGLQHFTFRPPTSHSFPGNHATPLLAPS
ncbi:hypothetical protein Pmani_036025 [Petrolisthes manimaculis]|uniref:Uncharacterized protein n=1 Tax=Petrolisthes manimaculis TaxID=1843537 RepID=A0AAE1NLT5_9EUCA|nr:hypothetical protein Pmani_036025 [Petrolisthes manimaculis]